MSSIWESVETIKEVVGDENPSSEALNLPQHSLPGISEMEGNDMPQATQWRQGACRVNGLYGEVLGLRAEGCWVLWKLQEELLAGNQSPRG